MNARRIRTFAKVPAGVGLLIASFAFFPSGSAGQIRPGHFDQMKARNIGPAGMSGRVAAVDVNPSDPTVVFVGASTGGVWRSTDGGLQWVPVFDDQPVLGIGAVAVSPANPDIVWVGTGEGNPRNSVGVGKGIYKSLELLLPDVSLADKWLTTPNDNPLFNGTAPLERMLAGQVLDLAVVRNLLDAERGGW